MSRKHQLDELPAERAVKRVCQEPEPAFTGSSATSLQIVYLVASFLDVADICRLRMVCKSLTIDLQPEHPMKCALRRHESHLLQDAVYRRTELSYEQRLALYKAHMMGRPQEVQSYKQDHADWEFPDAKPALKGSHLAYFWRNQLHCVNLCTGKQVSVSLPLVKEVTPALSDRHCVMLSEEGCLVHMPLDLSVRTRITVSSDELCGHLQVDGDLVALLTYDREGVPHFLKVIDLRTSKIIAMVYNLAYFHEDDLDAWYQLLLDTSANVCHLFSHDYLPFYPEHRRSGAKAERRLQMLEIDLATLQVSAWEHNIGRLKEPLSRMLARRTGRPNEFHVIVDDPDDRAGAVNFLVTRGGDCPWEKLKCKSSCTIWKDRLYDYQHSWAGPVIAVHGLHGKYIGGLKQKGHHFYWEDRCLLVNDSFLIEFAGGPAKEFRAYSFHDFGGKKIDCEDHYWISAKDMTLSRLKDLTTRSST